jgi:hypothetical protein
VVEIFAWCLHRSHSIAARQPPSNHVRCNAARALIISMAGIPHSARYPRESDRTLAGVTPFSCPDVSAMVAARSPRSAASTRPRITRYRTPRPYLVWGPWGGAPAR